MRIILLILLFTFIFSQNLFISEYANGSHDTYIEIYNGTGSDVNLSDYFITSKAQAKPMIDNDELFNLEEVNGVRVVVKKAKGTKCSRCWKILNDPCERNNCGLKN